MAHSWHIRHTNLFSQLRPADCTIYVFGYPSRSADNLCLKTSLLARIEILRRPFLTWLKLRLIYLDSGVLLMMSPRIRVAPFAVAMRREKEIPSVWMS